MMPRVTAHNRPQPETPTDPGVNRLLSSLQEIKTRASGQENDLCFLRNLLCSPDFQSLLKVHSRIPCMMTPTDEAPFTHDASVLLNEAHTELQQLIIIDSQDELSQLLQNFHFKALLEAHDRVAVKDFQPFLPEVPHEVDEDEESVKIVRIVKGNSEPLGATIKLNERTRTIHIARVMHGGAADRSGFIHVGDEVQAVNGVTVKGKGPHEVVKILNEARGTILLKLVPGQDLDCTGHEKKIRVRAHFSFDPAEDKLIPCCEAGLSFSCGDVLHIVSQEDTNWWQARRDGDRNMRAGLVPSKTLQERKMAAMQNSNPKSNKSRTRCSPKLGKKSKRNKKILYHSIQNEDYHDCEEVYTYEEVERYYPKLGRQRPLVLIGASGVGRNELRKHLITSDSNHYHLPVQHTSRPMTISDVEGEQHVFCTRVEMEADLSAPATSRKFGELTERDGHLYGTTMDSIRSVINAGHATVICPHTQALSFLRTAEIQSHIVLVKPPSLDRLKSTRLKDSNKDEKSNALTEDDLQDLIQRSTRLEVLYAHYADSCLVNDNLEEAVKQLQLIAHALETEPAWVPANWLC